jgi:hypothetical protein
LKIAEIWKWEPQALGIPHCPKLVHLKLWQITNLILISYILDVGIILGLIFRKWDVGVWTGLSWLRREIGGGLL